MQHCGESDRYMLTSLVCLLVSAPTAKPYSFDAMFLEGCSCKDICVTEITGRDAGCHGLGAMSFRKASYGGKDFSGTKAFFAFQSGKWVRIYVDAPTNKRPALTEFMKAALRDWGKLEGVFPSQITVRKAEGRYFASSNKSPTLEIKPVTGGDGKTAVAHTNLTSPLHSTLTQGETVLGTLASPHRFNIQKTSGFYNWTCRMRGTL
jgi:hypothetical protein